MSQPREEVRSQGLEGCRPSGHRRFDARHQAARAVHSG